MNKIKLILIMFILININLNINVFCKEDELNKLMEYSNQEITQLISSIVIRTFSSDSIITSNINDSQLDSWNKLLECTLEIINKNNNDPEVKNLYKQYLNDLNKLTIYLKDTINFLHHNYTQLFEFDKNSGALKINNAIILKKSDQDEIQSQLNNIRAKAHALINIIKNTIQIANRHEPENKNINITKKPNLIDALTIPKNLSLIIKDIQKYKKMANEHSQEKLNLFFKEINEKYHKIEFFTTKLTELKDFLTQQEKNIYTKLVPTIHNLIHKIEEHYFYLSPILSNYDKEKILNTTDKASFIIFNLTENLKSTFNQVDHELSMLLK